MDQEQLKQIVHYDPDTGVFTWLNSTSPRAQAGRKAGHLGNGYKYISIGGKRYKAARLAFLYMTGNWPVDHVDHINRNKLDDRWDNLREATPSQNAANRGGWGNLPKGVIPHGRKFRVFCGPVGSNRHLGLFETIEQASEAYERKAKELYGEFATI